MVLSGKDAPSGAGAEEVGQKTVDCLMRVVPAAVPGIVFLSGGQSDDEATTNLNAVNQYAASVKVPWELSFSFGRGLQAAPLKAWRGDMVNKTKAQQAFLHRANVTAAARQGTYNPSMEQ
jgi:fructose-bisphosphate aldolase class I